VPAVAHHHALPSLGWTGPVLRPRRLRGLQQSRLHRRAGLSQPLATRKKKEKERKKKKKEEKKKWSRGWGKTLC
jgi:hypothetical protein